MNIESVREYCLSLPLVTEDFPFDETTLAFRIMGKIFACLDLERPEWVTMKCNADYALELREVHPEIEGAWHWNKKYWNQVNLYGTLEDDFIQALIRHSYSEVVKKLKKQERMEPTEIVVDKDSQKEEDALEEENDSQKKNPEDNGIDIEGQPAEDTDTGIYFDDSNAPESEADDEYIELDGF